MAARRVLAVAASLGVVLGGGAAFEADGLDLDLGTVGIGGGTGMAPSTAATPTATPSPLAPPAIAPTVTPLAAIQPTSQISGRFIATSLPATSSYDEIIRLSPSVVAISPNGPGLGEAADVGIRGFADGQYNVTFDGIPFADSDDFSHHTTAYFMAHALGGVAVDRGPGTAATIGDATFGGTVSLQSRNPAQAGGGSVYSSVGSFGTRLFGAELDSGAIASRAT